MKLEQLSAAIAKGDTLKALYGNDAAIVAPPV